MPQEVSRFQQYRQPQKSRQIRPEPFRLCFVPRYAFCVLETSLANRSLRKWICNLEQPLKQIIQTMPFHHTERGIAKERD